MRLRYWLHLKVKSDELVLLQKSTQKAHTKSLSSDFVCASSHSPSATGRRRLIRSCSSETTPAVVLISVSLFTFSQQLLPLGINVLLSFLNHPLVALFEHMIEPALLSQEFFNRQLLLRLIGQMPLAFHDLIHRPYTCINCQSADLLQILGLISPSSRTWSQHIEETRTLCVNSLVCLFMKILEIAEESRLSCIRYIMSCDDSCQIFLVLNFSRNVFAGRGCGSISESRCR